MERTWMPTVAGILSIITGALTLLGSIFLGTAIAIFFSSSYDGLYQQEFSAIFAWLAIFMPLFIISLLAIIGGVCSLKRRIWGLALAGTICNLLTIWAWPLGVATMVFVSLSRNEFDHPISTFVPLPILTPPSQGAPQA